jgi:hypothetical protein
MRPDLDHWLNDPGLQVTHRRSTRAGGERLWREARSVQLRETGLLGRLVRWRIPGIPPTITFEELFRGPPFLVLEQGPTALVSGLVGRIWTLRRDYPRLEDPAEFRAWERSGTARVVFAHWVEAAEHGQSALCSEARVQAIGVQGRIGVRTVRPLVRTFAPLIGSEGIAAAVRRAEQRPQV